MYIYVANAPFTYIDPYGLWWWDNDILEWGLGSILGFHGKEAREAAIDAAAEYIYKHGPARGGWINVRLLSKGKGGGYKSEKPGKMGDLSVGYSWMIDEGGTGFYFSGTIGLKKVGRGSVRTLGKT